VLLEKSPPFLGEFCDPAFWPLAGNDIEKARISKKHKHAERMFLL
jgi:hypothetical protein